jgi:DNA-binding NtrC family response regulator
MMPKRRQRNVEWDTRTVSVSGSKRQLARFLLKVVAGADAGIMSASHGEELTIGTAPGNNLVLTDETVSRHHCSIEISPEGYLFKDLGSRNGSRIDGVFVESGRLHDGVSIQLGESNLSFKVLEDRVEEPLSKATKFGEVLGESPAMRRIFQVAERASQADASLLIEGETGTGKTALARELHNRSRRSERPFMVIDCASLVRGLVESELFGHEKGAFTGADKPHAGLFESAQGGTVFLDEIGELPKELQPKLLRVLESKTVTRVGSNTPIPVDFRLVAATNRDLRSEVNRGSFREDLYYRISTLRVKIPPLRERTEDLPPLAAHFYAQLSSGPKELPPELLRAVLRHPWHGNARELRNFIEQCIVTDSIGDPRGLAAESHDLSLSFREAKKISVDRWESSYLSSLMKAYRGNVSRASRGVKMDRNHLRDLLKKHGLWQRA